MAAIREGRSTRARRIGDALAAAGIPGAYEGAMKYVTSERLISRTHFARFLVEAGHVRETKDVFKRYLVPGKPGYVAHEWASPRARRSTGSTPPAARRCSRTRDATRSARSGMRELLGRVPRRRRRRHRSPVASHTRGADRRDFARHARVFGLLASSGSDYHGPGESWVDLGDMPPLPAGVTPVWQDW